MGFFLDTGRLLEDQKSEIIDAWKRIQSNSAMAKEVGYPV
jgi:hypothetical protein